MATSTCVRREAARRAPRTSPAMTPIACGSNPRSSSELCVWPSRLFRFTTKRHAASAAPRRVPPSDDAARSRCSWMAAAATRVLPPPVGRYPSTARCPCSKWALQSSRSARWYGLSGTGSAGTPAAKKAASEKAAGAPDGGAAGAGSGGGAAIRETES
eukprot:4840692-Prymnesium_polylepis.2